MSKKIRSTVNEKIVPQTVAAEKELAASTETVQRRVQVSTDVFVKGYVEAAKAGKTWDEFCDAIGMNKTSARVKLASAKKQYFERLAGTIAEKAESQWSALDAAGKRVYGSKDTAIASFTESIQDKMFPALKHAGRNSGDKAATDAFLLSQIDF